MPVTVGSFDKLPTVAHWIHGFHSRMHRHLGDLVKRWPATGGALQTGEDNESVPPGSAVLSQRDTGNLGGSAHAIGHCHFAVTSIPLPFTPLTGSHHLAPSLPENSPNATRVGVG